MKLSYVLAATLIGGLLIQQPADARSKERFGVVLPDERRGPDSLLERRSAGMSASDAAREAQHRYGGGKVLSVEPDGDGYRVKLVRDGDVRVVFIPNNR